VGYEVAQKRNDAEFELVDIKDFNLPLLDEPLPPIMGQYSKPHTKAWAAKIGSFDAYVFVTPEYNHGTSGALKNAIDFLFAEWNNKAAGFVSHGGASGERVVEQLRASPYDELIQHVVNGLFLCLGRGLDARYPMAVGLFILGVGGYWMSRLNLEISP
jgi:NAD(P)H-dependent FMN reductase